jgi:hypothetical protein
MTAMDQGEKDIALKDVDEILSELEKDE